MLIKPSVWDFSEEEAWNGEGSPYVMNRYDAERDPTHPETMSSLWPGRFVGDGVYDSSSTSNRPGTFTIYATLSSAGTCSAGISSGGR